MRGAWGEPGEWEMFGRLCVTRVRGARMSWEVEGQRAG